MKKWKLDRIISVATLLTSVIALVLVLKRPAPVSHPQSVAAAAANAQSFQTKIQQLDAPKQPGDTPAEIRLNSQEIGAALAQAAGAIPDSALQQAAANQTLSNSGTQQPNQGVSVASPNANLGPGDPDIKDYQVNFDGDVAQGQFLTQIGGKNVYVTVAGHLGSKDGFATFDPTEFKIGDLSIPVSLVNDALQKRLGEQKDKLKLPDSVGGIKVENGELVVTQK